MNEFSQTAIAALGARAAKMLQLIEQILGDDALAVIAHDERVGGEQSRLEPGQEPAEPLPEAPPPGATMVYKPQGPETQAATPEELGVHPEVVTLDANGKQHRIDKGSVLIGRSKDCDIRLADPNVSRRHAELRQEGTAYWILDLGSTNGLTVNGRRQQRAKLENDDRITVGSTELVFRRSDGHTGNARVS